MLCSYYNSSCHSHTACLSPLLIILGHGKTIVFWPSSCPEFQQHLGLRRQQWHLLCQCSALLCGACISFSLPAGNWKQLDWGNLNLFWILSVGFQVSIIFLVGPVTYTPDIILHGRLFKIIQDVDCHLV